MYLQSQLYRRTRGRELPGNYNHVLLTELFHHQSKKWPDIAEAHLENVHARIDNFVKCAISYMDIDRYVLAEIQEGMDSKLEGCKNLAKEELKKLCDDERGYLITYNHYYTDNVQKSRMSSLEDTVRRTIQWSSTYDDHGSPEGNVVDTNLLISTLHKNIQVEMDEQACSEALEDLNAYYKVR